MMWEWYPITKMMMIWGLLMSAGVELGVPMSVELEALPRPYDHQFHGK